MCLKTVEIFNKNQPMERIFDVKVLGMIFNQHLTWRNHINATTKKLLFNPEVLTNL